MALAARQLNALAESSRGANKAGEVKGQYTQGLALVEALDAFGTKACETRVNNLSGVVQV